MIEVCFTGHVGTGISLDGIKDPVSTLFNEELGAVMQVRESQLGLLTDFFDKRGFPKSGIHAIGEVNGSREGKIVIKLDSKPIYTSTRHELQQAWAETSYRMQCLRDNPTSAKEEYDLIGNSAHDGLFYAPTFQYQPSRLFPNRPKVAVLREQGVNGHVEMAWAFTAAGFDAVDVHMSDILSGETDLGGFRGLAACGGFSYGDVLGAGKGWAHSVLLNETARKAFVAFFHDKTTFALGVCNGCQFLSHLKEIIPGARDWPSFKPNRSERFEARVSMVEIVDGNVTRSSVFLRDMAGSKLPVAVAHGEGRAAFASSAQQQLIKSQGLIGLRYVDSKGRPTEAYPLNPNGSPGGITGVHTPDGRVLAIMPHPERVVTLESNSWYPPSFVDSWQGTGPWFKLFQSAREWCG